MSQRFFSAALIATAADCHARTIKRRADREGWPHRQRGNALEFTPPRGLRAKCLELSRRASHAGLRDFLTTPSQRAEIYRASNRYAAVCALELALIEGEQTEHALIRIARNYSFSVSPSSLRLWQRHFADNGLAGLLETKRGHSGRKPKARR